MAHQIEQMAYVGETPWHGLGNQLTQNQPIEVWAKQAGMDWRIESSNVSYMAQNSRGQSIIMPYEEQRYCIVQIPMPLYPWSVSVIKKSNRWRFWNFTET